MDWWSLLPNAAPKPKSIAAVQGASFAVAVWAISAGQEQFSAVLCFIAVIMAAGLLRFSVLARSVERS
jgi:hypothetical protein